MQRQAVGVMRSEAAVSERRACGLVKGNRRTRENSSRAVPTCEPMVVRYGFAKVRHGLNPAENGKLAQSISVFAHNGFDSLANGSKE